MFFQIPMSRSCVNLSTNAAEIIQGFSFERLLSAPHLVIFADCGLAIIQIQGRDRDWLSN